MTQWTTSVPDDSSLSTTSNVMTSLSHCFRNSRSTFVQQRIQMNYSNISHTTLISFCTWTYVSKAHSDDSLHPSVLVENFWELTMSE